MAGVQSIIGQYQQALTYSSSHMEEWVPGDLGTISVLVGVWGKEDMTDEALAEARAELQLCPRGRSHWKHSCSEDGCGG